MACKKGEHSFLVGGKEKTIFHEDVEKPKNVVCSECGLDAFATRYSASDKYGPVPTPIWHVRNGGVARNRAEAAVKAAFPKFKAGSPEYIEALSHVLPESHKGEKEIDAAVKAAKAAIPG